MKVNELMSRLAEYDPDMEVRVYIERIQRKDEEYDIQDVTVGRKMDSLNRKSGKTIVEINPGLQ